MLFTTTNKLAEAIRGVEIFSPTGVFILSIGKLFTVSKSLIKIIRVKILSFLLLLSLWKIKIVKK
tara:strand:- start:408 stop:602 length:195 start_codon:yes stop_codon:yes gene_type:complete